ncbi:Uncharacterized protein APZ42_007965 [Daphnia magna]|uniref:Uncharacterized protein n=1 Tax=Daphnia magna TaxID=35525 RepID=A0A164EYP3_9CRUS|nr:Uncharacterized protein APZ42_007965 [Daphnia magna]
MDRSSKRPAACSSSWAQKKKHSRDTPVSEFKEVNFSQITESMKEWDILFLCCDTLLKDSPDGRYRILIVCCMDVSCSFFKLTAMGSKGEEYFGLLEIGKSYMLKNGVVVRKGGRESSYSWMIENQFYLKTDAHSSVIY